MNTETQHAAEWISARKNINPRLANLARDLLSTFSGSAAMSVEGNAARSIAAELEGDFGKRAGFQGVDWLEIANGYVDQAEKDLLLEERR